MTDRRERAPWFGPRRFGWGWEPVTWQGGAVSAVAVVACLAAIPIGQSFGEVAAGSWTVVVTIALVLVCVRRGTRPGGPKARAAYERTATRRALGPPRQRPQQPPLSAADVKERLGNRRPDRPRW